MDATITVDILAERLAKVERENRIFRRAAVVAVVGLAVLLGGEHYTTHNARTLAAENFAVRNASGEVVAMLGVGSSGQPTLALSDGGGRVRIGMQLTRTGTPSIMLADADKKIRAGLALKDDGSPVSNLDEAATRKP
jgi:hypothetical protein